MKQNILTLIGKGTLGILILMTYAHSSASGQIKGARALEGSWTVYVTTRDCATGNPFVTFPRLNTFNQGGTMQEFAAAVAPSLRSPGHGVWSHSSGLNFSYAIQFLRFNADGTFGGSLRERRSVQVGSGGNTYSATGTAEIYNAAGILVGTVCATEAGTRFE